MAQQDLPPRCIICRKERTYDSYEMDEAELDTLMYEWKIKNAARIHRKYGAVAICPNCWERLGFIAEYPEDHPGGRPTQLVKLGRSKSHGQGD